MAWGFRAAGTVLTGVSPTPALPTGWQVGDLLLIVGTSGAAFSTAPTGYTQLALHSASPFLAIWYKFAASGETAKQVVNTNAATAAVVLAYSGVSVQDAISVVTTASSTTLATSSITTTVANDLVLSIYGGAVATSGSRAWTAPASTTSRVSQTRTTTTTGMLVCDENVATAGVFVPRQATTAQTAALDAYAIAFKQTNIYTQPVTTSSTGTISINRGIRVAFSRAVVGAISMVRGFALTTARAVTATVSGIKSLLTYKVIATTVTSISSVSKAFVKIVTINISNFPAKIVSISLATAISVLGTPNKLTTYFKQISIATIATIIGIRLFFKSISVSVFIYSFPWLPTTINYDVMNANTLNGSTGTNSYTVSESHILLKILTAVSNVGISLTRGIWFIRLVLSAELLAVSKLISTTRNISVNAAYTLIRSISKVLQIASNTVFSFIKRILYIRTITAAATLGIIKRVLKPIQVLTSGAISIIRPILKPILVSVSATTGFFKTAIQFVNIAVLTIGQASVIRRVKVTLLKVVTGSAYAYKLLQKLFVIHVTNIASQHFLIFLLGVRKLSDYIVYIATDNAVYLSTKSFLISLFKDDSISVDAYKNTTTVVPEYRTIVVPPDDSEIV